MRIPPSHVPCPSRPGCLFSLQGSPLNWHHPCRSWLKLDECRSQFMHLNNHHGHRHGRERTNSHFGSFEQPWWPRHTVLRITNRAIRASLLYMYSSERVQKYLFTVVRFGCGLRMGGGTRTPCGLSHDSSF
jgi:hypothetical protein